MSLGKGQDYFSSGPRLGCPEFELERRRLSPIGDDQRAHTPSFQDETTLWLDDNVNRCARRKGNRHPRVSFARGVRQRHEQQFGLIDRDFFREITDQGPGLPSRIFGTRMVTWRSSRCPRRPAYRTEYTDDTSF